MARRDATTGVLVDAVEDRWQPFRRALRYPDGRHFDRLFEHARQHAAAVGAVDTNDPVVPVLVAVVLEQEKRIAELEDRIEAVEALIVGE